MPFGSGRRFNQRARIDGLILACAQGSPALQPGCAGTRAVGPRTYRYGESPAPKPKQAIICRRESARKVEELRAGGQFGDLAGSSEDNARRITNLSGMTVLVPLLAAC